MKRGILPENAPLPGIYDRTVQSSTFAENIRDIHTSTNVTFIRMGGQTVGEKYGIKSWELSSATEACQSNLLSILKTPVNANYVKDQLTKEGVLGVARDLQKIAQETIANSLSYALVSAQHNLSYQDYAAMVSRQLGIKFFGFGLPLFILDKPSYDNLRKNFQ